MRKERIITMPLIILSILFLGILFVFTLFGIKVYDAIAKDNEYEEAKMFCNNLSSCDRILCKIKVKEQLNYEYDSGLYEEFNNCVVAQQLYKQYQEVINNG